VNRIALGVLLLSLTACSTTARNPWAEQKTVFGLPSAPRAIGGYSAGCVSGAVSLPPDGEGFQLMRLTRRRFYGHPELASFISTLGRQVRKAKLGTLLIGDLGQPRGGPTPSNHRSHQSGLDVDIWFWRSPDAARRPLTLDERETLSAPSLVLGSGDAVDPARFSQADSKVLRMAAESPAVERIFVHAAIKRHLCRTEPARGREWLRKLRPWFGHDDHFHVRLKCPAGSPECQTQETIPEGEGCDTTLDWWFSEEARAKAAEPAQDEIPPMPKLPAECEPLLAPG
jgi:penicillin-insensitive murein DD-endopeptidase